LPDHSASTARFDCPTSRATVHVEVGRRSAWLDGYGLRAPLEELDIPFMRDPTRRKILTVPIDRLGDLLALLEHRDRRIVELTAVDR